MSRTFRRRRPFVLALALAALGLAACADSADRITGADADETHLAARPGPDAGPWVGVNYNGQFDQIVFDDLERTETTWVRGFIDFFLFYDDPHKLNTNPKILKYIQLKPRGYHTILNIKWNFRRKSLPAPGSEEMEDYTAFLKRLLDRVWTRTDIIVVGNEPFIESRPAERNAELVAFYGEIARFMNDYRKRAGRRNIPIYVGAFNNLYLRGWRTEGVRKLLAFARSRPWIAGVDLHIHHGGIRQINRALDWVHPRIRSDQRILITEYSLMKHFRRKMKERIPATFAAEYGWSPTTKNYQYIDHALKNRVPREEWVDFLSGSYWFENRKRYLRNTYRRFSSYDKFAIATYAMRQSFPFRRDFGRNTAPWILNGIYANRTVERNPETGAFQLNYAWIDDFRRIQAGVFDR